ncbi:hypothetical protein [Streptomyces sp. NPDC002553]|uniref:hypothetical protein n=1 Tax=Streptomyces sp. NPDC002553 TaxID=3154417 RepID=UPI0033255598
MNPCDLRLRAAASHTFLAAAEDCTAPVDLPPDWFDAFLPRLHSGWARVTAGQPLPRMTVNFDSFGMVRAVGGDLADADAVCARTRHAVGEALGIPLMAENPSKMFVPGHAGDPAVAPRS